MQIKKIRFDRLRKLIDDRYGGNAGQCADYMDMKRPQINRWLTPNENVRQGISEDSARMIERKHSLPTGWLDSPDELDLLQAVIDEVSTVRVRGVKILPSQDGSTFSVDDNLEDPFAVHIPIGYIERHNINPDYLYAIKMPDESMQTSLYAGDIIVINTLDKKQVDGLVFAINYEGGLMIRRMKRDAGEWLLSADTHDMRRYPDKRMPEGSSIIGRIIYKQSDKI